MNNKNNSNDHTNGNARGFIWNPPGSDVTEENFDGGGEPGDSNLYLSSAERNSAVEISVGTSVSGSISEPGAEQFFKFTAPTQDVYSIFTVGDLDTIGYLYDSDGDLIILVDDLEIGSSENFNIIQTLGAGYTYYVKVGARSNGTGKYTLKVAPGRIANSVSVKPNEITLQQGVTYELPITPNYTYKGYNGAQAIPNLSVSVFPSDADNKKVWWWAESNSILECTSGWDDDGDRYIHVTPIARGTAKLYAQDWNENGNPKECTVISPYEKQLRDVAKFSSEVINLIIDLYIRIDNIFASENNIQKAWRCARLLSEFYYDTSKYNWTHNKWDDVAGSVTTNEDRKTYFTETLGYSESEYNTLQQSLCNNKDNTNIDNNIIDFAHMQYSLAARLAYTLDKHGLASNLGAQFKTGNWGVYSDEDISYLAGWLGDATLQNNDTEKPILKNDDYMADLDAENIYRLIIQGYSWADASDIYYSTLNATNTRAYVFLNHIPLNTVEEKIFNELLDDQENEYETIKATFPDTYNFLKSLNDRSDRLNNYNENNV